MWVPGLKFRPLDAFIHGIFSPVLCGSYHQGLALHLVQVEIITTFRDKAGMTHTKERQLEGHLRVRSLLEGPARPQFFLGQPAEPVGNRGALCRVHQ